MSEISWPRVNTGFESEAPYTVSDGENIMKWVSSPILPRLIAPQSMRGGRFATFACQRKYKRNKNLKNVILSDKSLN